MAKYISSPFGTLAGETLGVVASKNKGGNYVRRKTKAVDPKTAKQINRREIYEKFCQEWSKISWERDIDKRMLCKGKLSLFSSALGWTLKNTPDVDNIVFSVFPFSGSYPAPQLSNLQSIHTGGGHFAPEYTFDLSPYLYLGELELYALDEHVGYTTGIGNRLLIYPRKIDVPSSGIASTVIQKYLIGEGDPLEPGNIVYFFYRVKKTGKCSKPIGIQWTSYSEHSTMFPIGQ